MSGLVAFVGPQVDYEGEFVFVEFFNRQELAIDGAAKETVSLSV